MSIPGLAFSFSRPVFKKPAIFLKKRQYWPFIRVTGRQKAGGGDGGGETRPPYLFSRNSLPPDWRLCTGIDLPALELTHA